MIAENYTQSVPKQTITYPDVALTEAGTYDSSTEIPLCRERLPSLPFAAVSLFSLTQALPCVFYRLVVSRPHVCAPLDQRSAPAERTQEEDTRVGPVRVSGGGYFSQCR